MAGILRRDPCPSQGLTLALFGERFLISLSLSFPISSVELLLLIHCLVYSIMALNSTRLSPTAVCLPTRRFSSSSRRVAAGNPRAVLSASSSHQPGLSSFGPVCCRALGRPPPILVQARPLLPWSPTVIFLQSPPHCQPHHTGLLMLRTFCISPTATRLAWH